MIEMMALVLLLYLVVMLLRSTIKIASKMVVLFSDGALSQQSVLAHAPHD
jgi:hypothetical protein